MKTKKMVLFALFIALSYVGSMIRPPGPLSSVSFDSMPGFLAALMLHPVYGAGVAAIGHLLSALVGGFPMGLPIHLFIAAGMALTALIFGLMGRHSQLMLWSAVLIATLFNAYAVSLIVWVTVNKAAYIGAATFLLPIAFLNILLAALIYLALKRTKAADPF